MNNNSDKEKEEIIKTPEQLKKEEEEKNKPKLVLSVYMHPNGTFEINTTLPPPMLIWVMEQVKFSILKDNVEQPSKILQPPKGGIMNFARRFKS